jgi:hypothetical protein
VRSQAARGLARLRQLTQIAPAGGSQYSSTGEQHE